MNENKISAILGGLVIIVVGIMVVNYFRNLNSGTTTPTSVNTEETASVEGKKHTVATGENLWSIAQKYYNDGFKWTEIRDANNLSNSDAITVGQELIIPNIEASDSADLASPTAIASATPSAAVSPTPVISPTPTVTPTPAITPTAVATSTPSTQIEKPTEAPADTTITGTTYTVVRGDSLWKIAQKAYGDGNRWVEIAKANKLANPNLIHAGNVFTLPR